MMSRIPVSHRSAFARAVSTALCVAIAGVTATPSATAAAAPLPLLRLAPDEAPGSVLGLDGKDANASNTLTNALRKAFANRGISGGEEISLEEMRLTMGCSNDEVACLAEGGKTLGVRRLVFGYLKPTGGGTYQLDIQILDVQSGQLEAQATVAVTKAELGADQVDAKANAIVGQLMPAEDAGSDLPPRPVPLPETDDTQEDEVQEEPPPPREGKYYFGLERPSPTWKKAGFGISLGLAIAAAGVAIGTGVWLTADNLGFSEKLSKAAARTLEKYPGDPEPGVDVNSPTFKQVSPFLPKDVDLCVYNTHNYVIDPPGAYGQLGAYKKRDELVAADGGTGARDQGVADVCVTGERVRVANIVSFAVLGAAGVSTLVFTGLLLIHKRKPGANAMLRRGVSMSVVPSLRGGVTFAGGLRF